MPSSGPPPALQPTPANTNTTQPSPSSPPPAGRARLEATLRATSAEQVAVGQFVRYELTITNRGDGVAQNVRVADEFDLGLSHEKDLQNTHKIDKPIRPLAPNDSEVVGLSFTLVQGGRQCHRVTVTADGSDPVKLEGCVTGIQAAIEVKISGEHRHVVGEVAEFNVTIKNTGTSAATNVVLRVQFDPSAAIEPVIENGLSRLDDGSVAVQLGELALSERRVFRLQGRCRNPSAHACARASVTALGGAISQDEACLEILPALPSSPPPGAGGP
jgi:uncharacterized repeat protein (TIGR01451 family)